MIKHIHISILLCFLMSRPIQCMESIDHYDTDSESAMTQPNTHPTAPPYAYEGAMQHNARMNQERIPGHTTSTTTHESDTINLDPFDDNTPAIRSGAPAKDTTLMIRIKGKLVSIQEFINDTGKMFRAYSQRGASRVELYTEIKANYEFLIQKIIEMIPTQDMQFSDIFKKKNFIELVHTLINTDPLFATKYSNIVTAVNQAYEAYHALLNSDIIIKKIVAAPLQKSTRKGLAQHIKDFITPDAQEHLTALVTKYGEKEAFADLTSQYFFQDTLAQYLTPLTKEERLNLINAIIKVVPYAYSSSVSLASPFLYRDQMISLINEILPTSEQLKLAHNSSGLPVRYT